MPGAGAVESDRDVTCATAVSSKVSVRPALQTFSESDSRESVKESTV